MKPGIDDEKLWVDDRKLQIAAILADVVRMEYDCNSVSRCTVITYRYISKSEADPSTARADGDPTTLQRDQQSTTPSDPARPARPAAHRPTTFRVP